MLHVGHQNYISKDKITAIVVNKGSAVEGKLRNMRAEGKCVDCTQGKRTRSIIFLNDGTIVASSLESMSLVRRFLERD